MARVVFTGKVHTPSGFIAPGAVLTDGPAITAVDHASTVDGTGAEVIGGPGLLILPGFIDLQVNGAGGVLFTAARSSADLATMAAALASTGCTSFLPTAISAPPDDTKRAIALALDAAQAHEPVGARVLGTHLEGPFLNPRRAGAHDSRWLRPPNDEALHSLVTQDGVRLITIAPELPGALDLIETAIESGVRVAIGHTEATWDEVRQAIDRGATLLTHLFNAMPPLSAREPGVIGTALAANGPYAGLIADGVHVHPSNLALAARTIGADRLVLVTDAMPPLGTTEPTFAWNDRRVTMRDGACYLDDGTLAGSVLAMNQAIRNMQRLAGVPLADAVTMASATPARALGLGSRKGTLAPGMDADIVVCDEDLNVLLTMVEGRIVYRSASFPRQEASA